MSDEISRGKALPEADWRMRKYVRIAWAQVDEPVRFQCWSSKVYGAYLHWVGTANMLCADHDGSKCGLCEGGYRRNWYGWLAGKCQDTGDVIVAQIPQQSFIACTMLKSSVLLGTIIVLERSARARARVHARVTASRTFAPPADWREPEVGPMIAARYAEFRSRQIPTEIGGGE